MSSIQADSVPFTEAADPRSRHYLQGGYDYEFMEKLEGRYECPICLLCQRDPYQTSCGHRFCYSCILTWLNEGKTCPKDNCTLGEGDIFPDSLANREILQLFVKCPHHARGCTTVTHLSDIESHANICSSQPSSAELASAPGGDGRRRQFSRMESLTCGSCGDLVEESFGANNEQVICPKVPIACPFTAVGCTEKIPRKDLSAHNQTQMQRHMSLLCEKFMKFQQIQTLSGTTEPVSTSSSSSEASSEASTLIRTYSGTSMASTQRLLKDLFARVVRLEQKGREDEIEKARLAMELTKIKGESKEWMSADLGRFCNGNFLWRIPDFSSEHKKMRSSHYFVTYSQGFYTSPFGYRLCLRINIVLEKGEEFLVIYVHLMTGDNDDLLDWPLQGTIVITVINQDRKRLFRENYSVPILIKGRLTAYERPTAERAVTGFGIREFVRLNSLYTGGFISQENILGIRAEYQPPKDDHYEERRCDQSQEEDFKASATSLNRSREGSSRM